MEEKLRATPAARNMAKKMQVDLSMISGTGAKGRIHKEDVMMFMENERPKITPLAKKIAEINNIDYTKIKGSGFRSKIMKEDILALMNKEKPAEVKKEKEEVITKPVENSNIIPMSAMRKVIAKRMSESYFLAPTFTLNYEIDMTELKALRTKLIEPIKEKTGLKLTYTDLISMAVIKTLQKPEHKFVNASLTPDVKNIELHDYVNLSMAVGYDEGLLTPVLKNAEKMSLTEIVVGLKDLAKRALEMKLKPDEMSGSTFTISNIGMYGVDSFNPIINQPNSAILGVCATVDKPVVRDGQIVIRPMMNLCLTIDHRLVDGLAGAKFMQDLKKLLENPIMMLV
ncbi:dihydrolipoamide acetyltransferase [Sneathia sanguinegens]|uniref:Dihydrolipoamide acetyltransferase n=1 Tax=Sneathia sanguinegens TaxID=40543 RepID=A0ABT7HK87_9FUSO|nr:dihydrolipoamide acetyltransferase [Sneathia sanguinegens]MDK9580940.1 dihydrolipoamide acetyltransferase [Sneathia sanguinegens]